VLALVGGSGLYELEGLEPRRVERVETAYGSTSGFLTEGSLDGSPTLFLPRHGEKHSVPAHRVNYRANIRALADAGATRILAVCTVGAIDPTLDIGSLVLPDQLIDYTWGREHTFHEGDGGVSHVDFTSPYDPEFRAEVGGAMARLAIPFTDGGTYGAVQGPRFETAAEIQRMSKDGCTLVGMTGMPEAALAREAGIPYAAVCPVGNLAAGLADRALEFGEVIRAAEPRARTIRNLAVELARRPS
jgi:5'-deoxy-5'-methylthioadenosine phosphorylase